MRYMYPAIFTENELDGYSVQFSSGFTGMEGHQP